MKRIISYFVVISILLFLISCECNRQESAEGAGEQPPNKGVELLACENATEEKNTIEYQGTYIYRGEKEEDPLLRLLRGKFYYGLCCGQVLDADTKKPITGAKIMVHLHTRTPFREIDRYKFTDTDTGGKYWVPRIYFSAGASYWLKIYKAGYVVYDTGRKFYGDHGNIYEDAKFRCKNNLVLLEKWDDKKLSMGHHATNVSIMGCEMTPLGLPKEQKFEYLKYCREAREEMILGCLARYKKNPRTREQCEGYIDRDLRLNKKE